MFRRLAYRRRPRGTECPNDGTRLLPAPGGGLFCPFDGWRGTAYNAEPAPAGPVVPVAAGGYGVTPYGTGGYGE